MVASLGIVRGNVRRAPVRRERRFVASVGSSQAPVRRKRRFVASAGSSQAPVRRKRRFVD